MPDIIDWNVLVEDDASRYLESLHPDERRPGYMSNGLSKGASSFTQEEIDIVFDRCCPKV